MHLSQRGLDFIKNEEGCVLHLYNDRAGHCTIGYGHLVHHGPCNGTETQFLHGITQAQADSLLLNDVVSRADDIIDAHVTVPLTQPQFDALSSFVFNVGGESFETSTLLHKLNASDFDGAAQQFARWNHAGGIVLPDLTRRRAREAAMFLESA